VVDNVFEDFDLTVPPVSVLVGAGMPVDDAVFGGEVLTSFGSEIGFVFSMLPCFEGVVFGIAGACATAGPGATVGVGAMPALLMYCRRTAGIGSAAGIGTAVAMWLSANLDGLDCLMTPAALARLVEIVFIPLNDSR
jgi:hypothetical protein